MTRASSSARRPVSRRPARRRSSRSADPGLRFSACLGSSEPTGSGAWPTVNSRLTWPWASPRRLPPSSPRGATPTSSARRVAVPWPSSRATRASPVSSSPPPCRPGLASSGVDVLDAGVIPTPATAFLIDSIRADFGVMISASHNPAPDNGIKFFSFGGTKLPDEVEDRIESFLGKQKLAPIGGGVGRIRRFADAEDRYVVHLLGTLPNRLDGLHVVLDCAHGAAAGVSPETFRDAGAKVTVIGADPDGMNINDGVGSTHLEPAAGGRARARRRPRHRPRRRRRPLPRRRRRRQHRRRRPDHGDPRRVDARARHAHRRHARRDRDVEPRPAPRDGRARHPRGRDQGRRPLRARGARGRAASRSAASSRATSS